MSHEQDVEQAASSGLLLVNDILQTPGGKMWPLHVLMGALYLVCQGSRPGHNPNLARLMNVSLHQQQYVVSHGCRTLNLR